MYIVRFKYKYRCNGSWSGWHECKEKFDTIAEAKQKLEEVKEYHKTGSFLGITASKVKYDISRVIYDSVKSEVNSF